MTDTAIEAALAEASQWVGQVPGVVAVGQGEQDGVPTIDVWTTAPAAPLGLPGQLHGFSVRIMDTGGPIDAYDNHQ